MTGTTRHLIRKEFQQLRRDRRMAPILFVAPMVQLVIFGYAANLDVVGVRMAVCDQDRSAESRDLVSRFDGAEMFGDPLRVDDPRDVDSLMGRGEVGLALVIPAGFGERVLSGGTAQVQVLVDGSDSIVAAQGMSGAVLISGLWGQEWLEERLAALGLPAPRLPEVVPRVWYNPDLVSRNFMVPAILGMILVIMTTMLTSMSLVREKEAGTMEQLMVTPLRPAQLILGKLLPFVVVGLVQVSVVTAVAILWFHVPFRGSIAVLYLLALTFLLNTLGIGLLVSTLSQTQQQAMMTSMFVFMMPMIYFSGFVFPVESMPAWIRPVTYLVPLRYFLLIVRGIFLRGVGLDVLWPQALALTALGTGLLVLAIVRFRKTLD